MGSTQSVLAGETTLLSGAHERGPTSSAPNLADEGMRVDGIQKPTVEAHVRKQISDAKIRMATYKLVIRQYKCN